MRICGYAADNVECRRQEAKRAHRRNATARNHAVSKAGTDLQGSLRDLALDDHALQTTQFPQELGSARVTRLARAIRPKFCCIIGKTRKCLQFGATRPYVEKPRPN